MRRLLLNNIEVEMADKDFDIKRAYEKWVEQGEPVYSDSKKGSGKSSGKNSDKRSKGHEGKNDDHRSDVYEVKNSDRRRSKDRTTAKYA